MVEGGEKAPADDPSMEDILASIRRILADDDAPAGAEPVPEMATHEGAEGDVFVLDQTMLIEEPAPVAPEHRPAPELAAEARPAPEPPLPASQAEAPPAPEPSQREQLLAPAAEAAANASMGALVRVVERQQTAIYRGGPTLEEMVRDEIRPLVKGWLDENLPPMVERLVRAEIARLTGGK